MNIRFRFKKRSSSLVTLLAGAAFIWLATARLGLPKEKVVQWLIILFILLIIIIVVAAVTAVLIRWLIGRNKE